MIILKEIFKNKKFECVNLNKTCDKCKYRQICEIELLYEYIKRGENYDKSNKN